MNNAKFWAIAALGLLMIFFLVDGDTSSEPQQDFAEVVIIPPRSEFQKNTVRLKKDKYGNVIPSVPSTQEEAMDLLIASGSMRIPQDMDMRNLDYQIERRKHEKPKPVTFSSETVKIATNKGVLPLVLGIANTPALRASGLMHYKSFPVGMHGVLFLFDNSQIHTMWMKDTYLPLDMIFIDAGGRVIDIHENTTPLSTDVVASEKPSRAVLEIPAGSAKKWNIAVGNVVLHPFFSSLPQ